MNVYTPISLNIRTGNQDQDPPKIPTQESLVTVPEGNLSKGMIMKRGSNNNMFGASFGGLNQFGGNTSRKISDSAV